MGRRKFDRELIKESYLKFKNVVAVANHLNISKKTVRNAIKELNIKTTPVELRNRKYKVDESFFEQIDSQEKAYVLGFIFGDGNIVSRKYNHQLRIELATKDEEVLYNILKMIGSNHPVKKRKRKNAFDDNKVIYSSRIEIPRKKMVKDLIKIGLKDNKTKELKFPNLEDEFYGSFILGLSDSDGGIWGKSWGFIGTKDMCESIREILKIKNIESRIRLMKRYNIPLYKITVSKKKMIIKLRDFLYNYNVPSLSRKKEIFDQVKYLDQRRCDAENSFLKKNHSLKTKEKLRKANLGEKCGNAKLTTKDVIFIKSNLHLKTKDLASEFGVSKGTIRSIKRGDTWSHVIVKGGD